MKKLFLLFLLVSAALGQTVPVTMTPGVYGTGTGVITAGNYTFPANTTVNFLGTTTGISGGTAPFNISNFTLNGFLAGNGTGVATIITPVNNNIIGWNGTGGAGTFPFNSTTVNTALGNIATINLDGNASHVLYGNGTFSTVSGGGSGNVTANSTLNFTLNGGATNVTIGGNGTLALLESNQTYTGSPTFNGTPVFNNGTVFTGQTLGYYTTDSGGGALFIGTPHAGFATTSQNGAPYFLPVANSSIPYINGIGNPAVLSGANGTILSRNTTGAIAFNSTLDGSYSFTGTDSFSVSPTGPNVTINATNTQLVNAATLSAYTLPLAGNSSSGNLVYIIASNGTTVPLTYDGITPGNLSVYGSVIANNSQGEAAVFINSYQPGTTLGFHGNTMSTQETTGCTTSGMRMASMVGSSNLTLNEYGAIGVDPPSISAQFNKGSIHITHLDGEPGYNVVNSTFQGIDGHLGSVSLYQSGNSTIRGSLVGTGQRALDWARPDGSIVWEDSTSTMTGLTGLAATTMMQLSALNNLGHTELILQGTNAGSTDGTNAGSQLTVQSMTGNFLILAMDEPNSGRYNNWPLGAGLTAKGVDGFESQLITAGGNYTWYGGGDPSTLWMTLSNATLALNLTTASTSNITGAIVDSGGLGVAGNIYYAGTLNGVSDLGLKDNVQPISEAADAILSLHPISYVRSNAFMKSHPHAPIDREIGVSAQELDTLIPEAVTHGSDGNLYVQYDKLIAPTIAAVQQLHQRELFWERATGVLVFWLLALTFRLHKRTKHLIPIVPLTPPPQSPLPPQT